MKSKAKAERVSTHSGIQKSPSKAASTRSSERSPKKDSVSKETQSPSRKDATGTSEGDAKRHSNTGVLCSAIADKLRKEQK